MVTAVMLTVRHRDGFSPTTHPPLTQPLPGAAPPAAPAAAAGSAAGPAAGGAQRWTQWMTVQGAGAAAEATGAAGHEEGARALPALRGGAGPPASPPPPDAPAFDAVAYGVAPLLPPGRGAAAAAGELAGRGGRRVLVAGAVALAGGALPEPGVAPPELRRVQSAHEAVATKRATGRQRRGRPGADAQSLALLELEAPAAAGGGAIGVVGPATAREARSAGLEARGGGRAGGAHAALGAEPGAGRLLACCLMLACSKSSREVPLVTAAGSRREGHRTLRHVSGAARADPLAHANRVRQVASWKRHARGPRGPGATQYGNRRGLVFVF